MAGGNTFLENFWQFRRGRINIFCVADWLYFNVRLLPALSLRQRRQRKNFCDAYLFCWYFCFAVVYCNAPANSLDADFIDWSFSDGKIFTWKKIVDAVSFAGNFGNFCKYSCRAFSNADSFNVAVHCRKFVFEIEICARFWNTVKAADNCGGRNFFGRIFEPLRLGGNNFRLYIIRSGNS